MHLWDAPSEHKADFGCTPRSMGGCAEVFSVVIASFSKAALIGAKSLADGAKGTAGSKEEVWAVRYPCCRTMHTAL